MTQLDGQLVGKKIVARSFSRVAQSYEGVAKLQADIGRRLMSRLNFSLPNGKWLDLGCGLGNLWSNLDLASQQTLSLWGVDIAHSMIVQAKNRMPNCQWINADIEILPFAPNTMDGLVSNFALHWCGNWQKTFSQVLSLLKIGGQYAFAFPIKGSFFELADSWKKVDSYQHVHEFPEATKVFDALSTLSVSITSWQQTTEQMNFLDIADLVGCLRKMGVTNQHPQREKGLISRKRWKQFVEAYETNKTSQGLLPLSYKILWVYGKKC